jgi:GxxExxY protein
VDHQALTRTIIGGAMRVHSALGPGFLESVYQRALARELRDVALDPVCGARLEVHYRGEVVGEFVADMIVGGHVLVENKAVRALVPAHEAQLVNYLTATGIDVGLLLNFGATSLQFRRKVREYRRSCRDENCERAFGQD